MEEVVEYIDVGAQDVPMDFIPEDKEEDEDTRTVDEMIEDAEQSMFRETFGDTLRRLRSVEEQRSVPSQQEAAENPDLYDVPASPIRAEWPKDSLLSPSHFTIDTQHCISCHVDLKYAMPMNRIPKTKYLFCEKTECQQTSFLQCWACGQFQSENTGMLVSRPGNSAYTGPSSIHSFMCKHCYDDQIKMEPGLEETREMFAKYRQMRHENEEKEKERFSPGYLDRYGDIGPTPPLFSSNPTFQRLNTMSQPMTMESRKRARIDRDENVPPPSPLSL